MWVMTNDMSSLNLDSIPSGNLTYSHGTCECLSLQIWIIDCNGSLNVNISYQWELISILMRFYRWVEHPGSLGDGMMGITSRWPVFIRRTSKIPQYEGGFTTYAGWWCNNHLEKYESQWEGLSHILWKIKNVPNHQPVWNTLKYHVLGFGGWTPKNTALLVVVCQGTVFWPTTHNPQVFVSVTRLTCSEQMTTPTKIPRWPLTGQIRKPPVSTPPTMVECRGLTQFLWPKKADVEF